MITADEILNFGEPEYIFGRDPAAAKDNYLTLVKKWHPDVCKDPQAVSVTAKLNALYSVAQKLIASGNYGTFKWKDFELGKFTIDDSAYMLKIPMSNDSYGRNFFNVATNFSFANAKMSEQLSKALPVKCAYGRIRDSYMVTIIKNPKSILLRDVLNFYKGHVDPKHVAWIISSLYNIACYLNYQKLSHCDFSLDSIFIVPEDHSCELLGGWFYATKFGKKITAIPQRTFNYLPWEVRHKKVACPEIDGELIKACARELLGDIRGVKMADCPKPMEEFLKLPASGDPIQDYKEWGDVLHKCFGPRRFTELNLMAEQIYGKR